MMDKLYNFVFNILNQDNKKKYDSKYQTSYVTKNFFIDSKKKIKTDTQTFKKIKSIKNKSKKNTLSKRKINILRDLIEKEGKKKILRNLSKKKALKDKTASKEINWIKLYLLND